MTLDTPVSKAIAQRLKNVGFEFADKHIFSGDARRILVYEYRCTLAEAIEFFDSKGVYISVGAEFMDNKYNGLFYCKRLGEDNVRTIHPTRSAAYLAGIEPALNYLESKIKEKEK